MSGDGESKPISARRLQRMASVLARRQPGLSVVLEDVHDPHNVSAVLRSCDATGVTDVHLIYALDEPPQLSTGVAAGTLRWLTTTNHQDVGKCYDMLRADGKTILATTLSGSTVDVYDVDLTTPCVLVFGNESRGLSARAIELADACVRIPMLGMAESLNISVACAVILFEAMRQRRLAGDFDAPAREDAEMQATLAEWLTRDQRDPRLAEQANYDPTIFPLVWPRTQPRPETPDDETN